jgi:hypothetical protein
MHYHPLKLSPKKIFSVSPCPHILTEPRTSTARHPLSANLVTDLCREQGIKVRPAGQPAPAPAPFSGAAEEPQSHPTHEKIPSRRLISGAPVPIPFWGPSQGPGHSPAPSPPPCRLSRYSSPTTPQPTPNIPVSRTAQTSVTRHAGTILLSRPRTTRETKSRWWVMPTPPATIRTLPNKSRQLISINIAVVGVPDKGIRRQDAVCAPSGVSREGMRESRARADKGVSRLSRVGSGSGSRCLRLGLGLGLGIYFLVRFLRLHLGLRVGLAH